MMLSNEQLKTIYFGALHFKETADGYLQAFQYTDSQMDYFRNAPVTFWYDRCFATTAKTFEMTTVRHADLWWHDFYVLCRECEKNGTRPWIWSDYVWKNEELFLKNMPKDVVQNNWYYGAEFNPEKLSESGRAHLTFFDKLSERGYDQMPTGSVWSKVENFEGLVRYTAEHIDPSHLLGFMQSAWERTDPAWMHIHKTAADTIAAAKKWYDER